MSINGDMRLLIDWDKNGSILSGATYNANAVNILPKRLVYSGTSTSVSATYRTITPYSPVLLTATEIVTGDTVVFGTVVSSSAHRWTVSPSTSYYFSYYVEKLTGTNGGLTLTIRHYNSGGSSIGTSVANFTGIVAGSPVMHEISFTTPATTAYIRAEITQNGTNDTSDWTFQNFYLGTNSVGTGDDYVGVRLSQLEDVTGRLISAKWSLGADSPWEWIARSGDATFVIDNDDLVFLPEGTNTKFDTEVKHCIVQLQVYYSSAWHDLWAGFTTDIDYSLQGHSSKTIQIQATQGLEESQNALYTLSTYDKGITGNYGNSDYVDVDDFLLSSLWVPPNLDLLLRVVHNNYQKLITDTLDTGGTPMRINPKWRSDGVPVYEILVFVATVNGAFIYLDESGLIRFKKRPASGGTSVNIDVTTQTNNYKYTFGDDFYRGIIYKYKTLDTSRASSGRLKTWSPPANSNVSGSSTASATYTVPDSATGGDFQNFSYNGQVTYATEGYTDVIDETNANWAGGGLTRPTSNIGGITFGGTHNWTVRIVQTSVNQVTVYWINDETGTTNWTSNYLLYGDATAKTFEGEVLSTASITEDVPLMTLDFKWGFSNSNIYTTADIVSELEVEESMIRSITLMDRDDDSTWLARMLDLKLNAGKVYNMEISKLIAGASDKRHHVLGANGTYTPSGGLQIDYNLYRSDTWS